MSNLKQKRRWLKPMMIIVLLAAVAGGWYYFRRNGSDEDSALTTVKVARGDLEDVVTATGVLEPSEFVDIGSQVSGTLQRITVRIGQEVKKGELLAEIDPIVFEAKVVQDEAQLRNLEAQLESRKAGLTLAEQKLQRNQELLKFDAVSKAELETSEAEHRQAVAAIASLEAQIAQAKGSLDASRANLSYTKIFAPMDATVVDVMAREGQTLNANQSTPNLIRLGRLSTITVQAKVSEADIQKVKPSMEAYFTTLGDPDRRYPGKVGIVEPTPDSTNAPVFYNVLFDVSNTNQTLMPKMTAQVFFILNKKQQVLNIPLAAVEYAKSKGLPEGSKQDKEKDQVSQPAQSASRLRVFVLKGGEPTEAWIETGAKNRMSVEVISGLSEGDEVVTGPIEKPQGKRRKTRVF